MPYTQNTLAGLSSQIGILLDDTSALYWTEQQKTYAIWEALRIFGAYANYWRARGAFNLDPTKTDPYYDLSVYLPALRPRVWTLQTLVKDIQFMCLEAANGISGAGMSGQISIQSILNSVQRARNRFVLDSRFPLSISTNQLSPPPPQGTIEFAQSAVYVHRASWQDSWTGQWTNLWREDDYSIDRANPDWTTTVGQPAVYSESSLAPLTLQLAPAPVNAGNLEVITVDSLMLDLTDPDQTFNIPDEWIHAIKYAALADIFDAESQNKDELRAQYSETRYQQALDFAKVARCIQRVQINGVPLPIDALAALDAGMYGWRNQTGTPQFGTMMYDILIPSVGTPSQAFGITADVIQAAPIPLTAADFIQIGPEDLQHILNYATHMLTFKCGGKEFTDTMSAYDDFLGACASRSSINKAKIRYLTPLFGQPQREQKMRPDRMEKEEAFSA